MKRVVSSVIASCLAITLGSVAAVPASAATTGSKTTSVLAMAATPDGSRTNPYDMKDGVELQDYSDRTAYVKLTGVYKGASALKKAKTLTKKSNRSFLSYQLKKKGKRQVVILKVYIKAIDGYENSVLYADSILNYSPLDLYNKKATNALKNIDRLYLDKRQSSDVMLYNGGHDTVYIGFMLPKSVKSFCVSERGSWMRYDI